MSHTTLLRLVSLFTASCLVATAQTAGASAGSAKPGAATGTAAASGSVTAHPTPPTGPSVAVSFKTFALNSSVSGLYYNSNGTILPLSAQMLTPSPNTYTYVGPAKMEILRPDPKAAEKAAPAETAASATGSGRGGRGGRNAGRGGRGAAPTGPMAQAGTVTFPKSGNYILFLISDSDGASGIPLTNDPKDFPAGSIRFINVTNYPLTMKIVDEKDFNLAVKANDSAVYHPKNADAFVAQFSRTDIDTGDSVLGSQITPPAPGQRVNYFIYVGNRAQVAKNGDSPAFSTLINSESATANPGGPGPGGPGGPGRRGRGTGGGGGG